MGGPTHRIKRLVLELAAADERAATRAQEQLARLQRARITPLLERLCDDLAARGELVRIDRLTVDLGEVDDEDLERTFMTALQRALPPTLARAVRAAREHDDEREPAPAQPELETLAVFARTGALPWWAPGERPNVVADCTATLLRDQPARLAALLRDLARERHALARIVAHLADPALADLVDLAHARRDGAALYAALSPIFAAAAPALPARTRRALLWQALLATPRAHDKTTLLADALTHAAAAAGVPAAPALTALARGPLAPDREHPDADRSGHAPAATPRTSAEPPALATDTGPPAIFITLTDPPAIFTARHHEPVAAPTTSTSPVTSPLAPTSLPPLPSVSPTASPTASALSQLLAHIPELTSSLEQEAGARLRTELAHLAERQPDLLARALTELTTEAPSDLSPSARTHLTAVLRPSLQGTRTPRQDIDTPRGSREDATPRIDAPPATRSTPAAGVPESRTASATGISEAHTASAAGIPEPRTGVRDLEPRAPAIAASPAPSHRPDAADVAIDDSPVALAVPPTADMDATAARPALDRNTDPTAARPIIALPPEPPTAPAPTADPSRVATPPSTPATTHHTPPLSLPASRTTAAMHRELDPPPSTDAKALSGAPARHAASTPAVGPDAPPRPASLAQTTAPSAPNAAASTAPPVAESHATSTATPATATDPSATSADAHAPSTAPPANEPSATSASDAVATSPAVAPATSATLRAATAPHPLPPRTAASVDTATPIDAFDRSPRATGPAVAPTTASSVPREDAERTTPAVVATSTASGSERTAPTDLSSSAPQDRSSPAPTDPESPAPTTCSSLPPTAPPTAPARISATVPPRPSATAPARRHAPGRPPLARPRGAAPLDLRFSAAEEIYVHDAGLVVLWPFLGHFFRHLGLRGEQGFHDLPAQQRAACLLRVVATGELELAEYQLPLAKVLCGLAIDAPVDPGPGLRDDEREECERLLTAVVASAPILKKMSVEGLRGSFLLRDGVLGSRDGAWLLRVERRAYDLVLDRFPWSFGWVKLSWMVAPMRVEW